MMFNSRLFTGVEMEADGYEYKGQGTLPRPTLRFKLPKLGHQLQKLASDNTDFFFARETHRIRVTRIRTLVRFLDVENWGSIDNLPSGWTPDPGKKWPDEIFYLDRLSRLDQNVIEVELSTLTDLEGVRLPRRICISRLCTWEYREPTTCGYTGSLPTCDKTFSDCRAHFPGQTLPFGGFPSLSQQRS